MRLSVTHIPSFGYSEERIGLILCLGNAHFLIHIQTLTPSYIYGLLASSRGDYFLNLRNNDVRLVSGVLLQFESNYLGSCKYPSNTFRRLVICTIMRRYHSIACCLTAMVCNRMCYITMDERERLLVVTISYITIDKERCIYTICVCNNKDKLSIDKT